MPNCCEIMGITPISLDQMSLILIKQTYIIQAMQYTKIYQQYSDIASTKAKKTTPPIYAKFTPVRQTQQQTPLSLLIPSVPGGMAPIMEKEDEDREQNDLENVICGNVKLLVEFAIEMFSNCGLMRQLLHSKQGKVDRSIRDSLKQFETNENQFWIWWQKRYLQGFEKVRKIEIDMMENKKLNPESSREMQSLVFTQAFQPITDLIEDRLEQKTREEDKSPVQVSPVPKINIEALTSPGLKKPDRSKLKDLAISMSRSSSLEQRRHDHLRVERLCTSGRNSTFSQSSGERDEKFSMASSKRIMNKHAQLQKLMEANKEVRLRAQKSEAEAQRQTKLLAAVGSISVLMSFKLADLVNIALQEGSYFKTAEWCERNMGRLLVEHQQQSWDKQLFEAFDELIKVEKEHARNDEKKQSDNFQPIVEFFRTLEGQQPSLKTKPAPIDVSLQTESAQDDAPCGKELLSMMEQSIQTDQLETRNSLDYQLFKNTRSLTFGTIQTQDSFVQTTNREANSSSGGNSKNHLIILDNEAIDIRLKPSTSYQTMKPRQEPLQAQEVHNYKTNQTIEAFIQDLQQKQNPNPSISTPTKPNQERPYSHFKNRKLVKGAQRPTSSNRDQKLNVSDSEDWYSSTNKRSKDTLRSVQLFTKKGSDMKLRQSISQSQFHFRRKQRNASPASTSLSHVNKHSIGQLSSITPSQSKIYARRSPNKEVAGRSDTDLCLPTKTTDIQTSAKIRNILSLQTAASASIRHKTITQKSDSLYRMNMVRKSREKGLKHLINKQKTNLLQNYKASPLAADLQTLQASREMRQVGIDGVSEQSH